MSTITMLNGDEWDIEELLHKMRDNDFYYGYMGKNSLSSSSVKEILKSPSHYLKSLEESNETNDAFTQGRLIHEKILEPQKEYEWNVIEAKDKRSKAWKDAVAEDKPNTILKRDYNACMWVVDAFWSNKNLSSELSSSYMAEVPEIGLIEGLPFRVKADALHFLGDKIIDLKTTSDISSFNKWTCMKYGYDIQVYIYCTIFDIHYSCFEFRVIDKVSKTGGVFSVSEEFYEGGRLKTLEAIDTYKKYFIDNTLSVSNYIIEGEL